MAVTADEMVGLDVYASTGEAVGCSLIDQVDAGGSRLLLTFAGLDPTWPSQIQDLLVGRPGLREWLDELLDALGDRSAVDTASAAGLDNLVAVLARTIGGAQVPIEVSGLSPYTLPATVLSQLLAMRALSDDGMRSLLERKAEERNLVLVGHSAGLFGAAAFAAYGVEIKPDQAAAMVHLCSDAGVAAQAHGWAVGATGLEGAVSAGTFSTPMVSVRGIRTAVLRDLVERFGGTAVRLGVTNSPTAHVLIGEPSALCRFVEVASRYIEHDHGEPGGIPESVRWEPLATSAPFHHPALEDVAALVQMRWAGKDDSFDEALASTEYGRLIDPGVGRELDAISVGELLESGFVRSVQWAATIRDVSSLNATIIDVGPGRSIFAATSHAIEGSGATIVHSAGSDGRRTLFTPGVRAKPVASYAVYEPGLESIEGCGQRVTNRHTRLTGRSPVILGGMTPTTVDVEIVAAAAEAGHLAELAGGGQVTERIFELRMEELTERLSGGQSVVFNTLHLDPYLWDLHIGRQRLVQKAKLAGAPLCGVTISAGVPPLDEAVALLDEFNEIGLWCNAVKPGTLDQLDQAIAIAKATRHNLWIHLEGGHAGGHHSWQDLEGLLLARYREIRALPNVVLAGGGGVATPSHAGALLTGSWSLRHGEVAMPLDAVIVGTAAMATAESTASDAVKTALTDAAGHTGWVRPGDFDGGVTSGRSGLGADIHFLDNAASRTAALLDQVAGDSDAVEARRDEIVEALSRTAKPYFGDLEEMTYAAVLERFVHLVALGRWGRYEDGRWLDRSHREAFVDLVHRTEARLHSLDEGEFVPVVGGGSDVDEPEVAIARLRASYPQLHHAALHPADADWFVALCRSEGKPLPFVPVIDAEVRRWYQSDALWQAHHPAFDADSVLVIPGPIALAGITAKDEPVGELLDRFEAGAVDRIASDASAATATRVCPYRTVSIDGSAVAGGVAGADGDPVTTVMSLPEWQWAGRTRPNPLRRLGDSDAHALWLRERERVALRGGDDRVAVEFGWGGLGDTCETLELVVDVRSSGGAPIAVVNEESLRGAARALLAAHDADPSDPSSHAFSVGGASPLPDRWMRAIWPRVFAELTNPDTAIGVLDLLHLNHRVQIASPSLLRSGGEADDRAVNLTARRIAAPMGTIVQTKCSLSVGGADTAVITDEFLLRGHHVAGSLTSVDEEGLASDETHATPLRTIGTQIARTPAQFDSFAAISGDPNPIHRSDLLARFCGLPGRIAHGMWTSALAQRVTVDLAADGDADRLIEWSIQFVDSVGPEEELTCRVERVAMHEGARVVRCTVVGAGNSDDDERPIAIATAEVAPPRTALVFPGQGVQGVGMGMDGYERSPSAAEVWDRADAHCRAAHGFSVLEIVRSNPTELACAGVTYRHPAGVLFLTQFTQVSMATLACAQVAELNSVGVIGRDFVCAGHSVGEYNALASMSEILPLENLLDLVFARGLAMHALVPRDAEGNSDYRLGVVRPHLAGLVHEEVERLVAQVAESTGELCEVVNYNLRGKQYAVAGTLAALDELEAQLGPGSAKGRDPFLLVPGIDVPFHSSALVDGVADFREHLETQIPSDVDVESLVGRYVPNLYPVPFDIGRDYVQAVHELLDQRSRQLESLLEDWESVDTQTAGRVLLVELLAWQFASPVRWIETTDLLCAARTDGGLGIERIIEVGVGAAPTLTNLTKGALALDDHHGATPVVLHIEIDEESVTESDGDPVQDHHATDAASDGDLVSSTDAADQTGTSEGATTSTAASAPSATRAAVDVEISDEPVGAELATLVLVALRAGLRLDQVGTSSIDDLVDGASSRRNQLLMDLGKEFGLPAQDGAHEIPVHELATVVSSTCARYSFPGSVLGAAIDSSVAALLGPLGGSPSAIAEEAKRRGLGKGWVDQVRIELALGGRDGASRAGGELRTLTAASASEVLSEAYEAVAARLGVVLAAPVAHASTVDSAALDDLTSRFEDALVGTARHLIDELSAEEVSGGFDSAVDHASSERLALLDAEHGADRADAVRRAFDSRRHVVLGSGSVWARSDLERMYHLSRRRDPSAAALVDRVLAWRDSDQRVADSARWLCERARCAGDSKTVELMEQVLSSSVRGIAVEGDLDALDELFGPEERYLLSIANSLQDAPGSFANETVLITGASPGSIAAAAVPHLLRGGATVVVVSSSLDSRRVGYFRDLERRFAAPGAQLHLVPANLASFGDIDSLVEWMLTPTTEEVGGAQRKVKDALWPTVLIPFAAPSVMGEMPDTGESDEVALRVLLGGVQRLVGRLAQRIDASGRQPIRVVLPLSPNQGNFGGDGGYAAAKAALETMLARAESEQGGWGRAVRFLAPSIGWVRGTSLMGAHDTVADAVESHLGVRTFSSGEMGVLMAAACTPIAAERAADAPWRLDLTGGLAHVQRIEFPEPAQDLSVEPAELGGEGSGHLAEEPRLAALPGTLGQDRMTDGRVDDQVRGWAFGDDSPPLPDPGAKPSDLVVIVGLSEVGPWGAPATRREAELSSDLATGADLSSEAVAELAWRCGLVEWDRDQAEWVDAASGEAVSEAVLASEFREAVKQRCGVREFVTDGGLEMASVPGRKDVYLDRSLEIPVASEAEARSMVATDEANRAVVHDTGAGTWSVRLATGSCVAVPVTRPMERLVGGQLPNGFDPTRHGVPSEAAGATDRLALWNLVVTAEAFADAGLDPEELTAAVHPSLVANTQGTGMGGMSSLIELFARVDTGEARSNDVLQETLGNVIAAHVNQSLVGGYGPMVHPVGACATAAVSLEEAVDKLRLGKARFVVAGGWDDLDLVGIVGFGDMSATAPTDLMESRGLAPREHSRPGDLRRGGFVESQGGGAFLVTTGDVALELGLPVRAVVGYAASFGDGVHTSIPAPGIGALGCVRGKMDSPLAKGLANLGLHPDDIAVVSKHDTSTQANDPNEAELHERIQTALGRSAGAPLRVISQKSVTGHSKGGAAAWQIAGLCDVFDSGVVPGNPNLQSVDPSVSKGDFLVLDNEATERSEPVRAALLTSLGFGHVSAVVLLAHSAYFLGAVPEDEREEYLRRSGQRRYRGARRLMSQRYGREPVFKRRTKRPERRAEIDMLLTGDRG